MHTPCVVCSASAPTAIKATARRSTRATLSRLGPDPKSKSEQSDIEKQNFRQRYFKEEYCYVMDAKSKGNVGRYLNVSSCSSRHVQIMCTSTLHVVHHVVHVAI